MRLCIIALLTLTTSLAMALEVGAAAPALKDTDWIKGSAPDFSKQVTVVEFWATWCPPCRTSIPHLTKLQKQYGEKVAIIGLSDEDRPTVEPFVTDMGDKMDYAVGIADASVHASYMKGVSGIPHAFIVDTEGKMLWSGHPMQMDTPLAKIIEGTFDPEAAAKLAKAVTALEDSFSSNDLDKIGKAAGEVLKLSPAHDQAMHVLKIVGEQSGDDSILKAHLASIDPETAGAEDLNSLAWSLMTPESYDARMLEYAVPWAAKAYAKNPQPHIIDTHARARYLVGDLDGAIKLMEEVVAKDPTDADSAKTLAYYKQAKSLQ